MQPLLDRWLGENVAYISFDKNSFGLNQKGYPVLSTFLEHFLKKCLKAHIHIMVSLQHDVKSKIVYFKYYLHVLTKLTENVWCNRCRWQKTNLLPNNWKTFYKLLFNHIATIWTRKYTTFLKKTKLNTSNMKLLSDKHYPLSIKILSLHIM